MAADRLYARLNEPEPRDRKSPCRSTHRRPGRSICAIVQRARSAAPYPDGGDRARTGRSAARRCAGNSNSCTTPCRCMPSISTIPFSSRLFGTGWDDPQMAGYACWYNLQQIFSWLAEMGWQVILHTGVTTRSDLLQRFLQLAANHFPPATLNSWRFVWHWSPQASEAARRRLGGSSAGSFIACCRSRSWGSGTALPSDPGTIRCSTRRCWQRRIFSPAGQMPTNSWIWPVQTAAASSEHYPLHKLRQIHSALRQRQLNLPLWLLSRIR
ncbi:hypothetical protein J4733_19150 [Klebsiella pneumoniae]|uniref:Uncharacterized protein n=1 Tax=Klebsiella pneumoniae TaxID=573 RepID=A0A939SU52_KLEPN|nr:hypothetical protein [Klebsiella pneumoniae]